MRSEIKYEWCYETVDEDGDIIDNDHEDVLAEFSKERETNTLVLIRDFGNEEEGLINRSWAYVKDGKLPICFSGENGEYPNQIVPKRFHLELTKYLIKKH